MKANEVVLHVDDDLEKLWALRRARERAYAEREERFKDQDRVFKLLRAARAGVTKYGRVGPSQFVYFKDAALPPDLKVWPVR